jgi:uncharacterized membrane protein YeaQ/YmgE (transglycosylase-associated protein family)
LIVLLAIIVLLVVGGFVFGLVLKLLWLVLVGLVIGALARAIIPGQRQIGLLATALYGIGGSLLGGILADILDFGWLLSFVLSVVVAAALIAILDSTQQRKIA